MHTEAEGYCTICGHFRHLVYLGSVCQVCLDEYYHLEPDIKLLASF